MVLKKVVLVFWLSGLVIVFMLFNDFSLSLHLVPHIVRFDISLSVGVDGIILGRGSDMASLFLKTI